MNLCRGLILAFACLLVGSCARESRGLYSLKWAEKPRHTKPIKSVPPDRRLSFQKIATFNQNDSDFYQIQNQIREGDVIAYHMKTNEARLEVLKGKLTRAGYRLFDYGHLAIVCRPPEAKGLRLFSSESFKGPNTREAVASLETHSFDLYRLNQWDRLDREKFYEFIAASQQKAGNWKGYDFSGMFALWNSNLEPSSPKEIGRDYICSTVVAAALYYAGADLRVSRRAGLLDLVSPRQVVTAHGLLRPTIL